MSAPTKIFWPTLYLQQQVVTSREKVNTIPWSMFNSATKKHQSRRKTCGQWPPFQRCLRPLATEEKPRPTDLHKHRIFPCSTSTAWKAMVLGQFWMFPTYLFPPAGWTPHSWTRGLCSGPGWRSQGAKRIPGREAPSIDQETQLDCFFLWNICQCIALVRLVIEIAEYWQT